MHPHSEKAEALLFTVAVSYAARILRSALFRLHPSPFPASPQQRASACGRRSLLLGHHVQREVGAGLVLLALGAHRVLADVGGHAGGNLQLVLGLLAGDLQVGAALVQRLAVLTPRHCGTGWGGLLAAGRRRTSIVRDQKKQFAFVRLTVVPFTSETSASEHPHHGAIE